MSCNSRILRLTKIGLDGGNEKSSCLLSLPAINLTALFWSVMRRFIVVLHAEPHTSIP